MMQFATIEQTEETTRRPERASEREDKEEEGNTRTNEGRIRKEEGRKGKAREGGGRGRASRRLRSLDKSTDGRSEAGAREMRAPHQINHSQLIHFCH